MQIIYMVTHCLNFFQQVDSNGQILKSLTLINIPEVAQKAVFSKLIFNIQKKYMYYTMIILYPQIK